MLRYIMIIYYSKTTINSYFVLVVYKYMSVTEETVAVKILRKEYVSKSDSKYRKLFLRSCNPPDSIVRGSEGNFSKLFK